MTPPPTACLGFKAGTKFVSCTGGEVTLELVGEGAASLDTEMIRQAAAGVLHYFREELGRESVPVDEISAALAKVLHGFGLHVTVKGPITDPCRGWVEADLSRMAGECGGTFELGFFPRLRRELEVGLDPQPQGLRFTGLRSCVKRLAGAQRWSGRCEELSDRIVEYVRRCLSAQRRADSCALVIL